MFSQICVEYHETRFFSTSLRQVYSVLTLVNVWRAQNLKQAEGVIDPSLSQFYRTLSPEQVIRYWAMALISSSAFVFGCCWAWRPVVINLKDDKPWYTISGLHIDTKQLRIIERTARHEIGPATLTGFKGFFVSIPATGIIIFLLFGLGPEALSRYSSWLQSLSSFFKLSVSLCFSKKPTSRLPSWVNRHATSPIDPENFTPFHANDIAVDPTPFPYPPNIMNQPTHTLFTQSTIQPAHHPATLRGLRLDMGSNSQATSSNSGWHFSATNDSSWYLPTGSSPREEEMPPAYQPSASRNTALKDPLSPIV
ncbi:hypothetical protein FRC17_009943 [Serendipita sp. 399]|nr:hypothetical protein FRC17_009943 [Serendipita sp. 399]